MYQITPIMRGPIRKYELRRGAEYIGEFPTLAACEAMRDASEKAGPDDFLRGYIECIYFTDTGDDEQPEADAELSDDARAQCVADCEGFQSIAGPLLTRAYETGQYDAAQAGRDFWFTRNHHGVGFWDRKELNGVYMSPQVPNVPDIGVRLTALAHRLKALSAYASDDGSIGLEG